MMAFFEYWSYSFHRKDVGKKKTYLDKHSGKSILNISPHSSPFPTIHTNNPIHGPKKKHAPHSRRFTKIFECVYSKLTPKLASKNGCNATFFLGLHDSSGAEALGGCACKSPDGSNQGINPQPWKEAFGRWNQRVKDPALWLMDRVVTKDGYIPQRNPVQVRKAAHWTKRSYICRGLSSCQNLGIIIWLVRARRWMGCRNPYKLSFEKQNSQIQDTTLSKKW